MTKLMEHLHTNWSEMTLNDWQGLIYTLLALAAMVYIYVWVFRPKNKAMFDAQRDVALRDDDEHNNLGDK